MCSPFQRELQRVSFHCTSLPVLPSHLCASCVLACRPCRGCLPQALASWVRCLRPGGVAVVVMWPSGCEERGPWHAYELAVKQQQQLHQHQQRQQQDVQQQRQPGHNQTSQGGQAQGAQAGTEGEPQPTAARASSAAAATRASSQAGEDWEAQVGTGSCCGFTDCSKTSWALCAG